MEHEYQLVRPAFDTIVDYCNDLEANEKLIVFEFGWNCDLVLHIYKDAYLVLTSVICCMLLSYLVIFLL